jgi:hypothetical protein
LKSLAALTIAIGLLITAGYFATTTVSEQLSQDCAVGEEINSYQNSWEDVYFVWQWWPNRDEGKAFLDCIGPTAYLRYHPYDAAALALIGAGVAGYIAFNDKPKGKKKS